MVSSRGTFASWNVSAAVVHLGTTVMRLIAGTLFAGAFIAPVVYFAANRLSLFPLELEYMSYRFYTSLRSVAGDPVWIVQGFPSGILQRQVALALASGFGLPAASISTLELFAYVTLFIAYGAGACLLLATWLAPQVAFSSKLLLTLASITPWYVWSTTPLLLAPEYWVFELTFSLASALMTLLLFRSDVGSSRNRVLTPLLLGVWMGICVTLKPSMFGIALLPLAAYAAWHGVKSTVVAVPAAIVAAVAVVMAYYDVRLDLVQRWLPEFATFIQNPGGLNLQSPFDGLTVSQNSGDRFSFAVGIVVLLIGFANIAVTRSQNRRPALFLMSATTIGLTVHLYTLFKRPSSTSWLDLAIYFVFNVPVVLAMVENRRRIVLSCCYLVATLITSQVNAGWDIPIKFSVVGAGALTEIAQQAHVYADSLDRPVILLLPGGTAPVPTLEQAILLHGTLSTEPLDGVSLRARLLPRTTMSFGGPDETAAIQRQAGDGAALIWSGVKGKPPPAEVTALLQDPRHVDTSWAESYTGTLEVHVTYLALAR